MFKLQLALCNLSRDSMLTNCFVVARWDEQLLSKFKPVSIVGIPQYYDYLIVYAIVREQKLPDLVSTCYLKFEGKYR